MMVDEIAKRISTVIDTTRKPTRTGSNLVGIDAHMKALAVTVTRSELEEECESCRDLGERRQR